MSNKSDQIFSKLRDDLDTYSSFEEKDAYLKNHKYLAGFMLDLTFEAIKIINKRRSNELTEE